MEPRQLQIAFEHRLQSINPSFEVTNKPKSNTIFEFLNLAQERIINTLIQLSSIPDSLDGATIKVSSELQPFLRHRVLNPIDPDTINTYDSGYDNYIRFFKLPDDYYTYVRSSSICYKTYLQSTIDPSARYVLLNKLVPGSVVTTALTTAINKPIIRTPFVVLQRDFNVPEYTKVSFDSIRVIHDSFTVVSNLDLVYITKPAKFGIYGTYLVKPDGSRYDIAWESISCELHENYKNELVDIAVNLYLTEGPLKLSQSKPNDEPTNTEQT
jgi:hypothetical protein